MLNSGLVNRAEDLAYQLDAAGISLSPLPGTPLAVAVGACHLKTGYLADPLKNSDTDYRCGAGTYLQNVMSEIQLEDAGGVVHHDAVLKETVKVVAASIRGNLHDAQNIVLPLVKQVHEEVEQALRRSVPNVSNVLTVVPDDFGPVWDDPSLLEAVEKYRTTIAVGSLKIPAGHRNRTEEEVLDLLKSGSAKFDKMLREWATKSGANVALQIYRDIFVEGYWNEEGTRITPLNDFMGNGVYDRVRLLMVHFMARTLRADVDEGLNMAADAYDLNMATLIAETGRGICRIVEKRETDDKANRLIVSWPYDGAESNGWDPSSAQILVNADVYKRWLERGGRPEILMGSFVVDRERDPEELLKNGENYIRAWTRRSEVIRSTAISQRHTIIIIALRDAVSKAINGLDEEQVGPGGREGMRVVLATLLSRMRDLNTVDTYLLSRTVVCECMFSHRQSLEILTRIDAVSASNPSIDIREVALVVTIKMLCAWIAEQFVVHGSPAA